MSTATAVSFKVLTTLPTFTRLRRPLSVKRLDSTVSSPSSQVSFIVRKVLFLSQASNKRFHRFVNQPALTSRYSTNVPSASVASSHSPVPSPGESSVHEVVGQPSNAPARRQSSTSPGSRWSWWANPRPHDRVAVERGPSAIVHAFCYRIAHASPGAPSCRVRSRSGVRRVFR